MVASIVMSVADDSDEEVEKLRQRLLAAVQSKRARRAAATLQRTRVGAVVVEEILNDPELLARTRVDWQTNPTNTSPLARKCYHGRRLLVVQPCIPQPSIGLQQHRQRFKIAILSGVTK